MALWCLCYRHRASGASLEHCWSHFRFHNSLLTIKSICWCRHDEAKLGHVSFLAKIRSEKLTLLLWLNWKLEYIVTSPWFGTWIWFISGIVILSVLLAHNFIFFFYCLMRGSLKAGLPSYLVLKMVKHHSSVRKDAAMSWGLWACTWLWQWWKSIVSWSRALGKGNRHFGFVQTEYCLSSPLRSPESRGFFNSLAKCSTPPARNTV